MYIHTYMYTYLYTYIHTFYEAKFKQDVKTRSIYSVRTEWVV
jgi:hypothetical protein